MPSSEKSLTVSSRVDGARQERERRWRTKSDWRERPPKSHESSMRISKNTESVCYVRKPPQRAQTILEKLLSGGGDDPEDLLFGTELPARKIEDTGGPVLTAAAVAVAESHER